MPDHTDIPNYATPQPVSTGSMLVLMRPKIKTSSAVQKLEQASGLKAAVSRDYGKKAGALQSALAQSDCLYLDHLNVAVIKNDDGPRSMAMSSALTASDDVQLVRPEFFMYALEGIQQRYDAWVRDGLHLLADGLPGAGAAARGGSGAVGAVTDANSTWGIKAVGADRSPFTGNGIKVAILDTGFDFNHPDYAGRQITHESFVPEEPGQDGQGHGTHCTGTSCGPVSSADHPRYGVAPEVEIFIGKVLDNGGSGRESWILAGMEWAIENGCVAISMSLGRSVRPGEAPDPLYEAVGLAALQNNSLIIAAAGNDSDRRFGFVAPVGAPANSPSIMAVGAVDSDMRIADFSSGAVNGNGGEVDICAPGVDVFSSVPVPRRYARFPGTSMATPHVAGVAALLAQSDSALRGQLLWDALRRSALDVGLPISDGGAGLVQAPV